MKVYDSMQQHIEAKRNEIGYSNDLEVVITKHLQESFEFYQALIEYIKVPSMTNLQNVKDESGDVNITLNAIATILEFDLDTATINKLRKDKIRRKKDEKVLL
jgi:NTP pyrophosphatase (non-canonical NTP hydrolase)